MDKILPHRTDVRIKQILHIVFRTYFSLLLMINNVESVTQPVSRDQATYQVLRTFYLRRVQAVDESKISSNSKVH